jgi:hypothetical protein
MDFDIFEDTKFYFSTEERERRQMRAGVTLIFFMIFFLYFHDVYLLFSLLYGRVDLIVRH